MACSGLDFPSRVFGIKWAKTSGIPFLWWRSSWSPLLFFLLKHLPVRHWTSWANSVRFFVFLSQVSCSTFWKITPLLFWWLFLKISFCFSLPTCNLGSDFWGCWAFSVFILDPGRSYFLYLGLCFILETFFQCLVILGYYLHSRARNEIVFQEKLFMGELEASLKWLARDQVILGKTKY